MDNTMLTPWKRHAHEIAPLSTTSISSFSPSPDVPLTQSYADFMSLFERDCMESGYRRYKRARVPKLSTKVSVRPSTQYFVVLHKSAHSCNPKPMHTVFYSSMGHPVVTLPSVPLGLSCSIVFAPTRTISLAILFSRVQPYTTNHTLTMLVNGSV